MGKLFKTNGEIIEVSPKNKKYYSLKELQSFVNGYIEYIQLTSDLCAIINEEGRFKSFSFNETASNEIYKIIGIKMQLFGDVLICNINHMN